MLRGEPLDRNGLRLYPGAMRRMLGRIALLSLAALGGCRLQPDYNRPLAEGAPALIPLAPGERRPEFAADWGWRDELVSSLDRSIEWMTRPSSKQHFPIEGITHAHAEQSLLRFRELIDESPNHGAFLRSLEDEFTVFKSAGWDSEGGGVLFTGYCTPILPGSTEPGPGYDWPLYGLPQDLEKGPDGKILGQRTASGDLVPYPTREAIEASALLQGQGLELAWLQNPVDAYIAHVNGSAFIRQPSGEILRLGYSGKNGRPYRSLGKELVADGVLRADEVSLSAIRAWARETPVEVVTEYLNRNESYVFFIPIEGTPRGSLNLEVTGERTLATDKTLFPRGAMTFVEAELPSAGEGLRPFRRFMLDQDTGGAIRTAGRADIYLGVGDAAELRAGHTRSEGQLYYLFLKQAPSP